MKLQVSRSIAMPLTAITPLCALLTGCAEPEVASIATPTPVLAYAAPDRECLTRAMYFESNRSSDDGLRAVGTVVMNRLESGRYANDICGVVGQRGEFAPGVLSKPMRASEQIKAAQIADEVLAGQREKRIGKAMFFHQAGLHFRYKNMHDLFAAGGNMFYEKLTRAKKTKNLPPDGVAAADPSDPPQ
jgi:spore germination cell wall hydrolase CwlJ-like protein